MARETINGISVPVPGTGEPADFQGELRGFATDLPASYARRRVEAVSTRAAGVLCISWDDGFPMWDDVRVLANSLGQRHTFAVQTGKIDQINGITTAFVAAAHADGHEISSHSVTHAKLTTLATQAERLAEYDDSRAIIEGIIGAGECRTWTYPFGTANAPAGRDVTTDRELYLRYDRLLDTNGGEAGVTQLGGPPRFVIPRVDWNPGDAVKHARAMELVRMARWQPVIVNLYAHDPNVGWANVQALMNLAHELGIPCVRTDEAYPPVPVGLMDPGFEGPALGWVKTGDGTAAIVTKAPPTGYAGTKALALTSTAATGSRYVSADYPLHPQAAGLEHTLSLWTASDVTTPGTTPKGYGRVRFYGADYAQLGAVATTAWSALAGWTRLTIAATPPAGAVLAKVDLIQEQMIGTTYFDHVHVGPTSYGVLG